MHSIGRVKWFGGFNSRTGTANDFGFVEDADGRDIFLHARAWDAEEPPGEGDVVVYRVRDQSRGPRAAEAIPASDAIEIRTVAASLVGRLVDRGPGRESADEAGGHGGALAEALREAGVDDSGSPPNPTETFRTRAWELLATGARWETDLERLAAIGPFDPFETVPWHALPPGLFEREERRVAEWLGSLDPREASRVVDRWHDRMPISLLVHLASIGVIDLLTELGNRRPLMDAFVTDTVFHDAVPGPDYLVDHVRSRFGHHHGLGDNELLSPAMDLARFRKLAFDKDPTFVELHAASPNLRSRIDCFVLASLFGPILSGRELDAVYDGFLQRLWEEIESGRHDLRTPEARALLLDLLPGCQLMGPRLSCEAFFWKTDEENADIHLCRGKRCREPKVLPDPDRTWRDFTLHDWFAHYGIRHSEEDRPARRDFPIKLAGYFNRVLELLARLDCRECGQLMLPDRRYARSGRWEETGSGRVWINQAAAYRATVFHCPDGTCRAHGERHYISHCRGFRCHEFIDSRELDERCDRERYICRGCGSCCDAHEPPSRRTEQARPAGVHGARTFRRAPSRIY